MSNALGQRLILVIGSQCAALGQGFHLSFLPQLAEELYAVMTDPEHGQCISALAESGLRLNPTVAEAKDAIRDGFRAAAAAEATLFLAYIGHGTHVDRDFYLQPRDAAAVPDSDSGIHLVQLVKELHRRHAGLDGLVVLLDSCSSGVGGAAAAAHWVQELAGSLRFEVLTAAADRPAYDGCFTRALVDCLRQGLAHVPVEYLRSEHVRAVIEQRCPLQQSQLPTYNADEGLYLARNGTRAAAPAWAHTAAAAQLQRLTAAFQPTPVLGAVVTLLQTARCVAVVGPAGVGKSALVAGLAQPDVTEGTLPGGFIHAVAFLAESMSVRDLAQVLADQLGRSVPEFNKARQVFLATLTEHERRQLDSLQQDVLGPLRSLSEHGVIRLAIDGLEQLASASAAAVHAAPGRPGERSDSEPGAPGGHQPARYAQAGDGAGAEYCGHGR
jgi:hypothetical protein